MKSSSNFSIDLSDSEKDSEAYRRLDSFKQSNKDSLPLHDVARRYSHRELSALLSGNSDHNVKEQDSQGRTALHVVLEDGFLGHLHESNMIKCTRLLIDCDETVVNCEDSSGKTGLSLAVENIFPTCTLMLLEAKAHCSISLAKQIAHTMPDILIEMFDNGITSTTNASGENIVKLDWSPILQYPQTLTSKGFKHEQKETQFLYDLLDVKSHIRKRLLGHPLVEAFIHFKNKRLSTKFRGFYLISLLYPILYGTFIYFLYFERCAIIPSDEDDPDNSTSSTTVSSGRKKVKTKCEITAPITVASALFAVVIFFWALLEVYMQFRVDRKYLTSWRTWVFRVSIVVMGITLWPGMNYDQSYSITFQYPIASLGIFLAWVMFLIQIAMYQRVSIYLEMLVKILLSVIKIILMFLPLFIGFFMGFNLLFDDMSGVFSFIMMTVDIGQDAYETMMDATQENALWFEALAHTFCVGFIITIVIVFMNFLLALSIQDVEELKGQAKLASISRQIQNIFIADLIYPNSVLVKKEDVIKGKCQYEYNPKADKIPLPHHILLKITLLLKAKKIKRAKTERIKSENYRIESIPTSEEQGNEMNRILTRRLEEMERNMDLMAKNLEFITNKITSK